MNAQSAQSFHESGAQSGENILTSVCLGAVRALRARPESRGEGEESANSHGFDAEMRRYVFFFPVRLYGRHGAGAYLGSQDAARPVRSSDRRATQPEAPLSALLPTNNEIERFLGGREHDRTTKCFIDSGDRKYSFLRLEIYELKRPVA